ncbi:PREDICTED: uncharacterized protein LOC106125090 [Papilio xuthus]|uniref:Uncharacterized protein LOC106125090 n=1 Tax=Papilio xuthus TaxID=66420 RepID=A0AAJ6ZR48_PAPXU|nr:PREDICTED: uncharacterized protein LOC106125090 [Papilio xuthus]
MRVKNILLVLVVEIYIIESDSLHAFSIQNGNEDISNPNNNQESLHKLTSSAPEFEHIHDQEPTVKNTAGGKNAKDQYGYASIQYAPLILKADEYKIKEEIQVNPTIPGFILSNFELSKSNIEPRLEDNNSREDSRGSIIHGHNIQIQEPQRNFPEYKEVNKENSDLTTKETVNRVSIGNPFMYQYKTEKITEEPIEVELGNQELLNSPEQPVKKYIMLSKQYNNNANGFDRNRVLYQKETPMLQPQLVHVRPYRLHLNVARAFNIVNAPVKSRYISKLLPSCHHNVHKSDSTHLITPAERQTKLYPMQFNYSRI